jgi:phosphomannomutase
MSEGHRLDPTILREYDIRGTVDTNFTPDDVQVIGRAYGTMLVERGGASVAIGYDGRLSSPDLEAAAVDGLAACGLKVYRIGLGPTPMLYYATHALELDGGLMITGSHNPPEYNGIKMMMQGAPFFGADIQELGRVAERGVFAAGGGRVVDRPLIVDYVRRIAADYNGKRGLKVAWDAGNGSVGPSMAMLTETIPGTHVLLNEKVDGRFPNHHPDPTVEANLEQLKEMVRAQRCDLGIAFDGDGDRIGVVDGRGRVLWGDQILVVLAGEVLAEHPGATIIADVKASQTLFDEIARLGGEPLMWRTGHSLIKSKMAETKAPLAGEMSGHIFFADRYYGFDDALYAAVRLISIVSRSKQSLAEMRDALPETFNTPEVRIDCPEDRKFAIIDEVKGRLRAARDVSVNEVDGVRVKTADGWWLLRASNTQAVLVARCEATSEAGLERLKAVLVEQLKASGIEAPSLD